MARLLDLFCGAGGAAAGYAAAGFDVVGVDIKRQPRYPFPFVQADALSFPLDGFDAVHASPPCQDHSKAAHRNRRNSEAHGSGYMLAEIIDRLSSASVPWVVENVGEARFPVAVPMIFRLCGSSFGLDVRRHRLFGSNVAIFAAPCSHSWQTPRFPVPDSRTGLSRVAPVYGSRNYADDLEVWSAAMGVDWMTHRELVQAIPPVYTEWIGGQLLGYVGRVAA